MNTIRPVVQADGGESEAAPDEEWYQQPACLQYQRREAAIHPEAEHGAEPGEYRQKNTSRGRTLARAAMCTAPLTTRP
jgi:hypothetical protein